LHNLLQEHIENDVVIKTVEEEEEEDYSENFEEDKIKEVDNVIICNVSSSSEVKTQFFESMVVNNRNSKIIIPTPCELNSKMRKDLKENSFKIYEVRGDGVCFLHY
jgi:predicted ferric reductase